MSMEALLRAAQRDFSPEVLEELHLVARRLAETHVERLRTPDLANVMRLSAEFRKAECLRALRAALALLDTDLTPWQAAAALRDELDRFEQRMLPLLRRNPDHPLNALQRRLRVAFFCRVSFPRTQEGLYRELY